LGENGKCQKQRGIIRKPRKEMKEKKDKWVALPNHHPSTINRIPEERRKKKKEKA